MPLYVGDRRVQDVRYGARGVSAVYLGDDKVWSKTAIYFNFDTVVTPDLTSLGFVHNASGEYKAISDGSVARINMPDGFSTLGMFTDRIRYADATSPTDDGYLNFKFGSLGDDPTTSVPHYYTDILVRGSNAALTHGVGVRAELGKLWLLSRIAGTDAARSDSVSFDTTDSFRLGFKGNVWTLYRNGEFVGEWNDSGALASKGAGFRSLIMFLTGGRELFGPRRFSPGVDYVEYG